MKTQPSLRLSLAPTGPNNESPGAVSASFAFDGTGGIGGDFNVDIMPGQTIVLSTDSDVITSVDGLTQPVVNGVLDVASLRVRAGGNLIFVGPNTATILATDFVTVEGLISVNGGDNSGVTSLGTANQPETGAAGQGGGGDGGAGSAFTSQSTPRGSPGAGAFSIPGLGGGGGETTFAPSGGCASENRRGAGGGGGTFASSPVRYFVQGDSGLLPLAICQTLLGMDGEAGFPGSFDGTGADSGTGSAEGGVMGPSPFLDSSDDNDFFGTMITAEGQQIRGELPRVWAGAGGGGGGDAVTSAIFPRTPFNASNDEKGSGGGGGAGGLLILSIGDISVLGSGRVTADGGTGGGGENTNFFDRVGGGSGGGSGGHIVMSSAASIRLHSEATATTVMDFYQDTVTAIVHEKRPVRALGGQGGAGRQDRCGADQDGETNWRSDAIPLEAFEGRSDIPPNTDMAPITFTRCNELPASGACSSVTPAPLGNRVRRWWRRFARHHPAARDRSGYSATVRPGSDHADHGLCLGGPRSHAFDGTPARRLDHAIHPA